MHPPQKKPPRRGFAKKFRKLSLGATELVAERFLQALQTLPKLRQDGPPPDLDGATPEQMLAAALAQMTRYADLYLALQAIADEQAARGDVSQLLHDIGGPIQEALENAKRDFFGESC